MALARGELVRESGPLLLGTTVLILVLDLFTWDLDGFQPLDVLVLATMATLTALAWVRRIPAAVLPWVWAGAAVLNVLVLLAGLVTSQSATGVGYIVILCALYPTFTLFWRPTMAAAVVIVAAVTIVAARSHAMYGSAMWGQVEPIDVSLQTTVALAGGCVALYFRRRSFVSVADTTSALTERALTDGLTGALNRQGIEELGRRMIRRSEGPVFALFVDVNGLKAVNDTRGHDVGDEVIRMVARAIRRVVRTGDLIGRWGGDEFIVVGRGEAPDAAVIETRMADVLEALGSGPVWSAGVSVGAASGHVDFDALVAAADDDMYQRRARTRGTTPPA